jgi:deazaflavin-dependent oxidoreductase (nitroreductase family)
MGIVLDLADRSWPLLNRLALGHVALYRLSNGWVGEHVPGLGPMLLLDHVGARSRQLRTTPLVYTRDGEDLVLVASKGGHPHNPAWFHNLMAHPDTTVQVGRRKQLVHARLPSAEERRRLWPMVVKTYGGYEGYQQRTDREIPLVVLEPRVAA